MTSDNDPRLAPRFGGARAPEVDPYDRPAADPRRTVRKRLLGVVVALVAFGGFAGIAWYATSQGQKDQGAIVPVITADNEPIKERPLEPGGLDVPHRDMQVFSRIAPSGQPQRVEQLLPPPEAPVARPVPEPAQVVPEPPQIGERGATPAPPREVTAVPPPPPASPVVPAQSAPSLAAEGPKPAPQPAAPAAQQTAALPTAAWRVQLGATQDEARARSALAQIVKTNDDLLGNQPNGVERADLGAKGIFWRMRAGAFADRAGADDLCKKLAARKVSCTVVRP